MCGTSSRASGRATTANLGPRLATTELGIGPAHRFRDQLPAIVSKCNIGGILGRSWSFFLPPAPAAAAQSATIVAGLVGIR